MANNLRSNSFDFQTGMVYGKLTIIDSDIAPSKKHLLCKCECGNEKLINKHSMLRGNSKSCGCYRKEDKPDYIPKSKYKIEPGMRFGSLVVLEYAGFNAGKGYWKTQCDCGVEKVMQHIPLATTYKSCGICSLLEFAKSKRTYDRAETRLHNIWKHIRQRCLNPNNLDYGIYGDRGIGICQDWQDFTKFRNWSVNNGYAETLSIDRIDVNKNYEPTNCRWANATTQRNNQRRSVYYVAFGESKVAKDWSKDERCKVSYKTLCKRLKIGWNAEEAITVNKGVV